MSNLYRTREYDLTSWPMIWRSWTGGTSIEAPYTREEIEKEFQEGKARYQLREDVGEPLEYSEDLVPIAWTAAQKGVVAPPTEMMRGYWGTIRYALYSLRGEPLEFTTTTVTVGRHGYSVKDAKGKDIFASGLKNTTTQAHKIAVPAPGLYWLDYSSPTGDKWEITVRPEVVASVLLGRPYNSSYASTIVPPQMYFYVPKGTKNIVYYYTYTGYHPGGPHKVVDPAGNVVKEVAVNGDWLSIPVPADMDGKIWSFQNPVFGTFKFNNLPNYYAATPENLAVPREVATKDGLAIRK